MTSGSRAPIGNLPDIVTKDEWPDARLDLLAREKALTREQLRLASDRRRLPMVRIDRDYVFEGPDGTRTLLGHFVMRPTLRVLGARVVRRQVANDDRLGE
ncbi:MAG: DUF899 family protein [Acidimicrobiales bacterium]